MITILAGLLVLMLALLVATTLRSERQRSDSVARDVQAAVSQIDRAHRDARQAMNDAAGQSWRNLTD